MKPENKISLDHGEGGAATARLVREVFLKHLGKPDVLEDAAIFTAGPKLAFTTDSFIVKPLCFPGGDIGKLAVCGTVNDLAVMGAQPVALSAGFIIEEGLDIALLERIVASMAKAATESCVAIVTGDTKVVRKGEADGLFITTSGVGTVPASVNLSSANCRPGDTVIVSGSIGEHGAAVIMERENFQLEGDFMSDCQPLADLVQTLLLRAPDIRCMRDPTRGGLATTLTEIAQASHAGIVLEEKAIPIRAPVRAACELLGLDPLYLACEGRLIVVVSEPQTEATLTTLRQHPKGRGAAVIGRIVQQPEGVILQTPIGGRRPLIALEGAQFPRIC